MISGDCLMPELLRHLARLDIPGGGQVVAEGCWAYVGHMRPPEGTSIIDVADPSRPRIVSQLALPAHTHSHKVRAHGDIMLVNNELFRSAKKAWCGRRRNNWGKIVSPWPAMRRMSTLSGTW